MLNKSKSKQVNVLKYTLLIPLVFGMLMYSSCSEEKNVAIQTESEIIQQIENLKLTLNETELSEEERGEIARLIYEIYPNGVAGISGKKGNVIFEKNPNDDPFNEATEIPFGIIDEVPIFPGCEDLTTNEERRDCMAKNISQHIGTNFNTDTAKGLGLVGRQRINTIFKIDKKGEITDIRSRASHPKLEEEAIRVIKTLPTMIPGIQNGKKVIVPYSLPIIFAIE